MKSAFDISVNRNLTDQESQGKWDFEVTVTRKRDKKTKSLKGSGGEVIIDSVIGRLVAELRHKRRRR